MVGIASQRNIRRGAEAAEESVEIVKDSVVVKALRESGGGKEFGDYFVGDEPMIDLGVVFAVLHQQSVVFTAEARASDIASVPQNRDEAMRLQDAGEFLTRSSSVKPVKGLRCGDEIDAVIGQ